MGKDNLDQTKVTKFLRSELSFYVAIIVGVVSVAGFYFSISNQQSAISNRIDLLAQKLDFRIESDTAVSKAIDMLRADTADHEKRITTLETKFLNFK